LETLVENIVLKHQKEVACLGISLLSRNDWRFSLVRLKLHKNEITLHSSVQNRSDFELVKKESLKDIPVILQVDGWGILVKKNRSEGSSIPVNNEEFYIKEYLGSNGKEKWYSIIRTELLSSLMEFGRSNSLNIVELKIGPFDVPVLSGYFESGNEIKAGKWKLKLKDSLIYSLSLDSQEDEMIYNIGGDSISSGLLPLYASAVAFFSREREYHPILQESRESFLYGKMIKYLSLVSLPAILLILVINFVIWDNFQKRNIELTANVARFEQLLNQMTGKEKELKEKENLIIQYIGDNPKTYFSRYADKLASTLPSDIRLILMDIQPLKKKQKPGQANEYLNDQIEIEGETNSMSAISQWVKEIGDEKWVKKVELVSYNSDKEKSIGHFKLLIQY
jgi:Tfp pilus assembly protein PilN